MTWMLFDWAGTLAFAVSGAMVGLSRRMDIFGVTVLALLTAVGGGMVRDVLAGITPPVALTEPTDLLLSVVMAVLVSGVIMALLIEPTISLRMVLSFGPTGLVLGYAFRRRWSGAQAFGTTLVASVAGKLLTFGLLFLLTSVNPLNMQMDVMQQSFDETFAVYEQMGMDKAAIEASRAQVQEALTYLNLLLPFVVGVMGLLDAAVAYIEIQPLYQAAFNLNMVAMGAGVIQGLSLMSYVMDRFRVGKVMRICLYAFVLLGGVLMQILAFTGLFDMLFDYRRRFGQKKS